MGKCILYPMGFSQYIERVWLDRQSSSIFPHWFLHCAASFEPLYCCYTTRSLSWNPSSAEGTLLIFLMTCASWLYFDAQRTLLATVTMFNEYNIRSMRACECSIQPWLHQVCLLFTSTDSFWWIFSFFRRFFSFCKPHRNNRWQFHV